MRIKKILTVISFILVASLLMGAGCWIFPINKAPEITSIPNQTATLDVLFTYDVEATDPDDDILTYSLIDEPTGMLIDGASGLITWTPNSAGSFGVTVEVSDGLFSVTQDFTIVVSAAPSNDATLSDLTVDGETIAGFGPGTLTYSYELLYGTTKVPTVTATPTDPNAEAVVTPAVDVTGTTTVLVTADDGTKLTYKVTFSVAAKVPMDIIVVMPTITVGEAAEIEIIIVANDDAGTMVNGYFTLPLGDYEISCDEWSDALLPGTSYKVGTDDGYLLTNTTLNFEATFNSAETYLMTLAVRTVVGDKVLCSKDIEVVVEEAPLKVGDSYGGGIVAYTDGTGHGLIAATEDQSDGIAWITGGDTPTTLNGNTSTDYGTGQANTNAMMNQIDYDGGAAKVCNEYSITVGSVTYDDWFLPSRDELFKLYRNKVAIGGFADSELCSYYWSSSEVEGDAFSAWIQDFYDGGLVINYPCGSLKSSEWVNTFQVRAVRAF
ncbi:hypothetical protein ES705_27180 [subsurface metagenome]